MLLIFATNFTSVAFPDFSLQMKFPNSKPLRKHVFMTQFLYFNRWFEYSEDKIKERMIDYYTSCGEMDGRVH